MNVRRIDSSELQKLVDVHNVTRPDDPVTTVEFEDWRRQAEDTLWVLAETDGTPVGAGVGVFGWHTPPGRALGELYTVPGSRRLGAGSSILAQLSGWARSLGCHELVGSVAEDDPESIAWTERRGFAEIGRHKRVELDLTTIDAPTIDPPPGIEIEQWSRRPGIEAGLYAVYCEAELDIPGEEDNEIAPLEQWLSMDMQGTGDPPEAVFVAFAGDEVVGYAKLSILGDSNVTTAYHDLTGVLRAWRGRGIAGALKRAQIAWAKENGFEKLATANEERNAPIRALNERHGYRPVPGRISVRASL